MREETRKEPGTDMHPDLFAEIEKGVRDISNEVVLKKLASLATDA